jgi:hypothetical protein
MKSVKIQLGFEESGILDDAGTDLAASVRRTKSSGGS